MKKYKNYNNMLIFMMYKVGRSWRLDKNEILVIITYLTYTLIMQMARSQVIVKVVRSIVLIVVIVVIVVVSCS